MPKPKWEDAPDWAKWLAQDYYGEWYWYAHKPKISDSSAMWQAYIGFSLTGFLEDHRIMHYSQYYKDSQKHDEFTGKFITYSKMAGYTPPDYPYNDNWKNTLEKRPKKGEYKMAVTNKEITMPNDSATILSRESLTQMSLIQQLMSEFKELPNNEKVVFICTLFPFVDAANVIVKINEQYPNYIFAKLAENDKLFHPIAGIVEIFDVNAHSFKFYGNGTKWESDRNGYLIVNGKKDAKRTVFLDLDDYVKHMKKQG